MNNFDRLYFFVSSFLGAIALQPAPPVEGRPVPQVVWPVRIDCNSSDPEATLKECQIELTKMDIPNPPQSFVAGFQCQTGIIIMFIHVSLCMCHFRPSLAQVRHTQLVI